MKPRSLFIAVVLVVGLISGGVWLYVYTNSGTEDANKTAYITVTAAPHDSSVKLNGKAGQIGLNHVVPGNYKVTIAHDGFASVSKDVTVAKGQDVPVAYALTPNTAATANWYIDHPDDAAIARTITDPKYSSVANYNKSPASIRELLPYSAGGDYPFVIAEDPDSEDPNNPLIYVESDSQQAKADALTWLRNQGYDPAKLNLKYTSTTDPSRP